MTLLLWLGLACCVAGLAAAVLGMKGRRSGEHLHCRRCGFDVSHSGSVCGECGSDLGTPRSTVRGVRRRRPVLTGVGVVVLLVGGGVVALQVRDIDWIRHKPASWLIADVRAGTGEANWQAWNELRRRDREGRLSDSAVRSLAVTIVDHQADPKEYILDGVGKYVTDARGRGLVSDDLWTLHAERAVLPVLIARKTIRQGDALPFYIEGYSFAPDCYHIRVSDPATGGGATLAGQRAAELPVWHGRLRGGQASSHMTFFADADHRSTQFVPGDVTASLPVGRHELRVVLRVEVATESGESLDPFGVRPPPLRALGGPVVATATHELTTSVDILPAGSGVPLLIVDETDLRAVIAGVRAVPVVPATGQTRGWSTGRKGAAVGFEMSEFADTALRMHRLTIDGKDPAEFEAESDGGSRSRVEPWRLIRWMPGADAGAATVDVRWHYSESRALETTSRGAIYPRDLVLRDVPVTWTTRSDRVTLPPWDGTLRP